MIISAWRRWVHDHQRRWLLIMGAAVLLDAIIGPWLIVYEWDHVHGMWLWIMDPERKF